MFDVEGGCDCDGESNHRKPGRALVLDPAGLGLGQHAHEKQECYDQHDRSDRRVLISKRLPLPFPATSLADESSQSTPQPSAYGRAATRSIDPSTGSTSLSHVSPAYIFPLGAAGHPPPPSTTT